MITTPSNVHVPESLAGEGCQNDAAAAGCGDYGAYVAATPLHLIY
jgi:hypothetical protein